MRQDYTGSILDVREAEDCIRATKKYTKGAFTKQIKHPMQGQEFPSKVLSEYYEVYPEMELSWDMPATNAWAWIWGDTPHIVVKFYYNYFTNKAYVRIHGNNGVVDMLREGIPGFSNSINRLSKVDKK